MDMLKQHDYCYLGLPEQSDIIDNYRRTPVMQAQELGFAILEQHLRCTLTESRDSSITSTRVTDNNTDAASISLSSIEGESAQQEQVMQV
jgi:hypothetical protein